MTRQQGLNQRFGGLMGISLKAQPQPSTSLGSTCWKWLTLAILTCFSTTTLATPAKPDTVAQARIIETYGKLPLHFEANQGQTDSQVKFLSRSPGYSLFLTPTEAVLSLRKAEAKSQDKLPRPAAGISTQTVVPGIAGTQNPGMGNAENIGKPSAAPSPELDPRHSPGSSPGQALARITKRWHGDTLAAGTSQNKTPSPLAGEGGDEGDQTQTSTLRLHLPGANPNPRISGVDPLPGKVNYFRGKDPAKWRTNVPTYAKVKYEGIYPGIDLVFYGNPQQLEYDFIVAPGADPKAIRLSFKQDLLPPGRGTPTLPPPSQGGGEEGVGVETSPRLDANGDLVFSTEGGEVRLKKPVVYQEIDGMRREVEGRFVLSENTQITFQLAHYDKTQPLIIDPVLVYSTYLGGSGGDWAGGIAIDQQAEQRGGVVGLTAATRIGTLDLGEVEVFDHGGDVAGQVGFRQPFLH